MNAFRKIIAALIVCAIAIAVLVPHNSAMADHGAMHQAEHHLDLDTADIANSDCCQMVHCEIFANHGQKDLNIIENNGQKALSGDDLLRPGPAYALIRPPRIA